ncbi:hypothetical protein [Escherichia phage JN01]|uniref:Uncharacterized protein n=1 Tax=Escherichia phage JN01 TaxID=2692737 RepID=A0A6B9SRZ4_9CAUD|nr:hypothetical protein [Escherichia phage JN01]
MTRTPLYECTRVAFEIEITSAIIYLPYLLCLGLSLKVSLQYLLQRSYNHLLNGFGYSEKAFQILAETHQQEEDQYAL